MKMPKNKGIVEVLSNQLLNGSFLCRISLDHLSFPDYQRAPIKSHFTSIANEWDHEFANPLKISLRQARMNCFDGRQTSAAAIHKGLKCLDAFVWQGWSYEREARAFFIHNTVPKGMNGWKRFSADLKAGNRQNQLILEVLTKHGLTTPCDPWITKEIHADVSKSGVPLEMMGGGLELLVLYAQVMRNWKRNGVLSDTAKATDFGRGLKFFLTANMTNQEKILKALKIITPDQIREHAKDFNSTGRIDQSQIRQAFESLTGGLITLPRRRNIRKAA